MQVPVDGRNLMSRQLFGSRRLVSHPCDGKRKAGPSTALRFAQDDKSGVGFRIGAFVRVRDDGGNLSADSVGVKTSTYPPRCLISKVDGRFCGGVETPTYRAGPAGWSPVGG